MKYMGRMAVMGALSLALVACGGNAASTATSAATSVASTVETTTTTTAPKAITSVVGSWKLAGVEQDGIYMGGDMSAIMAMVGELSDDNSFTGTDLMTMTLNEDGTGSFSMAGEAYDVTWVKTDTGADMTPVPTDDNPDPETAAITIENDALFLNMDGSNAVFTADGSWSAIESVDLSATTAVTSEEQLVGDWKMTSVYMMGITMQGEGDALAEQMGYDSSTMTIAAGGKATAFGEEVTYTVDADGAKINVDGMDFSLKMLNGNLVLDMGDAFGVEMAMVFSK